MVESDLTDGPSSRKITRRTFFFSAATLSAGLYTWWSMNKAHPSSSQASVPNQKPEGVTIVEFSDSGERKGAVHVPKIVKSYSEWRQQLSPNFFFFKQKTAYEMAFTGQYWNLHDKGLYRCI